MLMGNHHVTGVALYHTNDAAPSADGDWKPMDQLVFSEPSYHGVIEENRAYDRCYVAKPITVVIQTRAYASDVMWSIDDGPTFGNGDYPDNRVITEHVDISQYTPVLGQHVFNYYDRDAPVGGWNGAYFELYAHDGTYLGGEMAAMNLCSGVFCVALVSRYFLKERLTPRQLLGFALLAGGVILVVVK